MRLVSALFFCIVAATAAHGVDLSAGDILVTTVDGEIIHMNPSTGRQTPVLLGPSEIRAVTADRRGNVFAIAGDDVLRIGVATGSRTVISSGGLLASPPDIAAGPDGNLYLLSETDCCEVFSSRSVIRVDPDTGAQMQVISTVNGPGGPGLLFPLKIEVEEDGSLSVLVLDLSLQGSFGGVARIDATTGIGDFDLILSGGPYIWPPDFAIAPNGNILVLYLNFGTSRFDILDFDPLGTLKRILSTPSSFFLIEADLQGRMIGATGNVAQGTDLMAIDLESGQEIFVSSLSRPVWDMAIVPGIPVETDIRPGGQGKKPINPFASGVIPVALLGSEQLDVTEVDAATLAFGPEGAPLAHRKGPRVLDVNGDSFPDLLARFRIRETGIAVGDRTACLHGRLNDGTLLEGCDDIMTLPPRFRPRDFADR